ncbi:MAG: TrkA-C domain protein [uncultured Sulfurovum sp.]|uniref:TrkA-C domain protein n=1 Tax=uncultured Sulfurovum sp. TaxID=269237 RepID=A0A6S6TIG9_9BACT|nr:MAG: TrkA-C domain protein [uncultured Sulfurovum sp.]
MTYEQITLFLLMGGVLILLVWGKWRYDFVAFGALSLGLLLNVIPQKDAFSGFGHPAVIIIALVLIISKALSQSGAIEMLSEKFIDASRSLGAHIASIGILGAVMSAFMNNVATLALLMPVDIQTAKQAKRSPAKTLMPLSFATILGGMVTLIGTPPNIVISQFRETALGDPYSMFDFAWVGLGAAFAGIVFVSLIGWRLVPESTQKKNTSDDLRNLDDYTIEIGFDSNSPAIGQTILQLEQLTEKHDTLIVGLIRRGKRLPGNVLDEVIRKSDLLVIEANPKNLESLSSELKLSYSKSSKHKGTLVGTLHMTEVTIPYDAQIVGQSAYGVGLLYRHEVMLLGISRQGKTLRKRVRKSLIQAGDVLLLMGGDEQLNNTTKWLGALPLENRGLQVIQRDKAGLAVSLFALAIVLSSFGIVYLPVALSMVVVIYGFLKVLTPSQMYDSVEWSVIVLVASLIPIGAALEASGGTQLIANSILSMTQGWPVVAVLALLMVVTMTLSDMLNNVATVLIAAPIGISLANELNANPDAFLMGVAVAASCAFLSPIGHKNNTIIMGPGGYKFGDYWRMGLPLELLILAVSIPLIMVFWPL